MGEAKRRKAARLRLRTLAAPAAPRPITTLVVPAGPSLPSREIARHAIEIAEAVRVVVREILLEASAAGGIDRMRAAIDAASSRCADLYEDEVQAALVANSGHRAEMNDVQCRRGCAFCCYVDVVVTPLEAIRLARGGPPRAPAVVSRPRSPCPLLADGVCSVYAARPLACRAIFSTDVGQCEAGYLGAADAAVPSLDWPRHLACGYITGTVAALDDLGLASHLVDLRAGLALIEGDATALVRWLNGEDVFQRRAR